jgi:Zn-dependent alcohol dehydrogenase
VIVDTSGTVDAIERAIPMLASGGRFIMIGQPKPGQSFRVLSALDMFHGEGKKIISTQGGGFRPAEMIPRYVNLWRAGRLDLKSIVSHTIGLAEINDGIDLVRKGLAGRVMVAMR